MGKINIIRNKGGKVNFRQTILTAIETKMEPDLIQKELNKVSVEEPGNAHYPEILLFRLLKEVKGKKSDLKRTWSWEVKNGKLYQKRLSDGELFLYQKQPQKLIDRVSNKVTKKVSDTKAKATTATKTKEPVKKQAKTVKPTEKAVARTAVKTDVKVPEKTKPTTAKKVF